MNSVPAALKKGTPASPAIALASSVLPAPTTSHAMFTLLVKTNTGAEPLHGTCVPTAAGQHLSGATEVHAPASSLVEAVSVQLFNGCMIRQEAPPVPGAPTSSTPAGERAPRSMKRLGFLRNSTSSRISALTSSMPSMSLKVSTLSPLLIWSSFAPPQILRQQLPCYRSATGALSHATILAGGNACQTIVNVQTGVSARLARIYVTHMLTPQQSSTILARQHRGAAKSGSAPVAPLLNADAEHGHDEQVGKPDGK